MSDQRAAGPLRLHPELLGPLAGEPAVATGSTRLFPGEERFLSERQLRRRRELADRLAEPLSRVLDTDEEILYVLPALELPPFLHQIALGWWWQLFFHTALVLTDRRLVEILLSRDDKQVGTRTRSFPWSQVARLDLRLGSLTLRPAEGRKRHRWRVTVRGDRKLLRDLLPRVAERLLPETAPASRPVPLWHCPACGASHPQHPAACHRCQTPFKSRRRAALLSVAFPGAGLLYAGHPVLALFDFLGEALLFCLVAFLFLTATGPEETVAAAMVAAVGLALTKVESVHLASLLAHRTHPERGDPARWRTLAVAGVLVSVVALAGPIAFTGALAPTLARDLDLTAPDLGWSGGSDRESWQWDRDDPDKRSEWHRADGTVISVFAFPLAAGVSFGDVRTSLDEQLAKSGSRPSEPIRVGAFEGARAVLSTVLDDGTEMEEIRYLLHDREGRAVQLILTASPPEDSAALESELRHLVEQAEWVFPGNAP